MSGKERGVALVTGASSGIGLATARALRRNGYQVFGTSRKPMADTSDGVTMLVCDVTDDRSVQSVVEDVVIRAGRIDLLVNNAGIGLLGGAEESSAVQAKALFDVNVFGVVRLTNAVLPIMRRQRKGRIINMSSILGLIPAPSTPSMHRPSMRSRAIRNRSTTRCERKAFASCWSSLASPARLSRKISRVLISRFPSTTPFAPMRKS
ncbi:NADP-dependent 3-hydroxy acid dehydrogenase YdfG [Rhizobium sp. SG570]|nr:NADP-dependent 3-hydroxy acid dehydrogenase YdfG [Rhizobium sp. SG570]